MCGYKQEFSNGLRSDYRMLQRKFDKRKVAYVMNYNTTSYNVKYGLVPRSNITV